MLEATGITREKLFEKIEKLKEIVELPNIYLENYFSELRNDVDKEFWSKKIEIHNDENKQKELDRFWEISISKIDSFEQSCIQSSYNSMKTKTIINEIETMLNNQETINLNECDEKIENEKTNFIKELFQNKQILFVNLKDKKNKLLVLLNDEFISKESLEEK